MGLFSPAQIDAVTKIAEKTKAQLPQKPKVQTSNIATTLANMSESVIKYFSDSEAKLVTDIDELTSYISRACEHGIIGLDTETTGLDRIRDEIVGFSLYYPDEPEIYIPVKHRAPIFESLYPGQLDYDDAIKAMQQIADSDVKLAFANADFDLSMIHNDFGVDLSSNFWYDVILAWRCLKENEPDNALKTLYAKYVEKSDGKGMKFRDFFTPEMFPYCKPEVAKLYAANDAKITYKLMEWQMKFLVPSSPQCKKNKLERISDLVWGVEFPLVAPCNKLHTVGIHFDNRCAKILIQRYKEVEKSQLNVLAKLVDTELENSTAPNVGKRPFSYGSSFNPNSPVHVKYLLYTVMRLTPGKDGQSTAKEVLHEINLPITNQILAVRSTRVLLTTFLEKLPKEAGPDGRIHARFNQIGAGTGRMSSASPNLQNIPSHAADVRHMFRATPASEYNTKIDSDTTTLELGGWESVQVNDANKYVCDLSTSDKIQVTNSEGTAELEIIDIEEPHDDQYKYVIKLNVDGTYKLNVQTPPYVLMGSDYS